MLLRVGLTIAAFLSFCALLSVLVWLTCGDGWRTLRIHRRLRRREQSRTRAAQWHPRVVAIRRFSQVKLVGIDQVSPKERKLRFLIR